MRVIAIDSDARRTSEPAMCPVAMERAREKWEKLKERVASGDLKQPEKIAAAERILPRSPGDRYSAWELRPGAFAFFESKTHLVIDKRPGPCALSPSATRTGATPSRIAASAGESAPLSSSGRCALGVDTPE
jgi:hypothetical protein